jgi:dihydrofolate reductase
VILGSGELVRSLMRYDLVDEVDLLIHPLVLGSGHRLFGDDGAVSEWQLVDSQATPEGVIVATYRPREVTVAAPAT